VVARPNERLRPYLGGNIYGEGENEVRKKYEILIHDMRRDLSLHVAHRFYRQSYITQNGENRIEIEERRGREGCNTQECSKERGGKPSQKKNLDRRETV